MKEDWFIYISITLLKCFTNNNCATKVDKIALTRMTNLLRKKYSRNIQVFRFQF